MITFGIAGTDIYSDFGQVANANTKSKAGHGRLNLGDHRSKLISRQIQAAEAQKTAR